MNSNHDRTKGGSLGGAAKEIVMKILHPDQTAEEGVQRGECDPLHEEIMEICAFCCEQKRNPCISEEAFRHCPTAGPAVLGD